ncbi:unnamed protein product, partial [Laminaria digitata]
SDAAKCNPEPGLQQVGVSLILRDRRLRDLRDLGAMRRLCNRTSPARTYSLRIAATGLCLLLFRPCQRHHQVAGSPVESPDGQFSLEGSSIKWVTARPREGHAAACLRHGLDPTAPVVFLSDQVLPALVAKPNHPE